LNQNEILYDGGDGDGGATAAFSASCGGSMVQM